VGFGTISNTITPGREFMMAVGSIKATPLSQGTSANSAMRPLLGSVGFGTI
jgi:hypothetical protein